jgi:hypothetical protein
MLFNHTKYEKINVKKLLKEKTFKTGDIILFKSLDHLGSVYMASYWTHIGVVYVDPDEKEYNPVIFEATCVEFMEMPDGYPDSGIFCSPLINRIIKYPGKVAYRQLTYPLPEENIRNFKEVFLPFALNNMYYNKTLIRNGFRKYLGLESYHKGTNCAELAILTLVNLNILPEDELDKRILHHISYACTKIAPKKYNTPVYITYDHLSAEKLSGNHDVNVRPPLDTGGISNLL